MAKTCTAGLFSWHGKRNGLARLPDRQDASLCQWAHLSLNRKEGSLSSLSSGRVRPHRANNSLIHLTTESKHTACRAADTLTIHRSSSLVCVCVCVRPGAVVRMPKGLDFPRIVVQFGVRVCGQEGICLLSLTLKGKLWNPFWTAAEDKQKSGGARAGTNPTRLDPTYWRLFRVLSAREWHHSLERPTQRCWKNTHGITTPTYVLNLDQG